jgi:hypothetical protein
MADWRNTSMALILADGIIGDDEIKVLRKELLADGKIDQDEVTFLVELRNSAQKKAKAKKVEVNPKFEKFFGDAVKNYVLADGKIDDSEADWLRKVIFADKKVDAGEKKLLTDLKKTAKSVSPKFDKLYNECMKK